jgi:hypothetical protein
MCSGNLTSNGWRVIVHLYVFGFADIFRNPMYLSKLSGFIFWYFSGHPLNCPDFSRWWENILSSCWVYSASNRNEYQKQKKMFLGSKVQWVCRADNLTAICELTMNSLWTIFLMSKEMMSMLLTLLFTCLAFSDLPWLRMPVRHPCPAHDFFPECLSNHCLGLRHTFSEICTKFNVVPLSVPTRNDIRPDTWL